MSVVSLILILISRPCFNLHTQYQNVLEDIEELHHLGLTVTDLLEIQELTQTVSQEELETVSEVLAGLSEDQVLALADKSSQELDLIFNLQWNRSKARRKRSPSPFGLSLTADIRTHHISYQGWSVPGYPQHFPAQTPVRWFPVPGLYQHHPGHHAGVGPLLHHGDGLGGAFWTKIFSDIITQR